jgi:hypothetical protein
VVAVKPQLRYTTAAVVLITLSVVMQNAVAQAQRPCVTLYLV